MKEAKIPPRSPENAPNCFTPTSPRRESPPKFGSPSFLDRSTHSDSSISQIYLKISYAPAYKKSKIKQKVQAVMRSVKAAWRARGTIVRRDRSVKSFRYCFFFLQSKISDDAWQMTLNRPNLGKSGVSCALNELRFVDFSVRSFDV